MATISLSRNRGTRAGGSSGLPRRLSLTPKMMPPTIAASPLNLMRRVRFISLSYVFPLPTRECCDRSVALVPCVIKRAYRQSTALRGSYGRVLARLIGTLKSDCGSYLMYV
jgi:hypothetical protein